MPLSPYRVLWLEIAERQYLDLPEDVRRLADERSAQLERDPRDLPDAVCDSFSDPWSAPVATAWSFTPSLLSRRPRSCCGSSSCEAATFRSAIG